MQRSQVASLSPSELREIVRKIRGLEGMNPWSIRNRLKATLSRLPPEKRDNAELIDITAMSSVSCKFMSQHPIEKRVDMCKTLELESFKKGALICKSGEIGQFYYAIVTGSVGVLLKTSVFADPALVQGQLTKDGKHVKVEVLTKGTGFGEMSLITGKPRSASIVADTNCELFVINKETFLRVFEKDEDNFDFIVNFLQTKVRALQYIPPALLKPFAEYCSVVSYQKDHIWYPDDGVTINIVLSGQAIIAAPLSDEASNKRALVSSASMQKKTPMRHRFKKLFTLDSGQVFGESCCTESLKHGWVVWADSTLECIQITKNFFVMHVDKSIREAIKHESFFRTGYVQGRVAKPQFWRAPGTGAGEGASGGPGG
eukprot:CAMPEP_0196580386 /NCGR_PEP_ID=MMETSP1081-20130531/28598_1 /TAXON_ID=36882 /ORGANISM="Pyramimonas amylifera, Strain CCMP720" /LENGTH=371 /DNA_ID=CAMNT_0041900241 /DNA_START=37 /DNA_END=1148 /DNA_ORIENTATION=+